MRDPPVIARPQAGHPTVSIGPIAPLAAPAPRTTGDRANASPTIRLVAPPPPSTPTPKPPAPHHPTRMIDDIAPSVRQANDRIDRVIDQRFRPALRSIGAQPVRLRVPWIQTRAGAVNPRTPSMDAQSSPSRTPPTPHAHLFRMNSSGSRPRCDGSPSTDRSGGSRSTESRIGGPSPGPGDPETNPEAKSDSRPKSD